MIGGIPLQTRPSTRPPASAIVRREAKAIVLRAADDERIAARLLDWALWVLETGPR